MFDFDSYMEREAMKSWSDEELQDYNLLMQYYDRELTLEELEDYTDKTLEQLERIYT